MDIHILAVFFWSLLTMVFKSSSQDWGGLTIEIKTYYADVVAVGNVTRILDRDPLNVLGETYGAEIEIQCTYKGGTLPSLITLGGISQGVCEVTANDKFVLFLKKRQAGDYYSQSDAAEPYSKLGELIQICNLERRYPQENNVTLKRKACPPPTQLSSCKPQGMKDNIEIGSRTKNSCIPTDKMETNPNQAARNTIATTVLIVMPLFLSTLHLNYI